MTRENNFSMTDSCLQTPTTLNYISISCREMLSWYFPRYFFFLLINENLVRAFGERLVELNYLSIKFDSEKNRFIMDALPWISLNIFALEFKRDTNRSIKKQIYSFLFDIIYRQHANFMLEHIILIGIYSVNLQLRRVIICKINCVIKWWLLLQKMSLHARKI